MDFGAGLVADGFVVVVVRGADGFVDVVDVVVRGAELSTLGRTDVVVRGVDFGTDVVADGFVVAVVRGADVAGFGGATLGTTLGAELDGVASASAADTVTATVTVSVDWSG